MFLMSRVRQLCRMLRENLTVTSIIPTVEKIGKKGIKSTDPVVSKNGITPIIHDSQNITPFPRILSQIGLVVRIKPLVEIHPDTGFFRTIRIFQIAPT